MKCTSVATPLIFLLFAWSVLYSYNHDFQETFLSIDIPAGEKKELCINNSSSLLDLWNKRYLHISSSNPQFELYSKKTIIVSFLRNKRVSDRLEQASDGSSYSTNVRMFFSQCYLIENRASDLSIHIDARTYRSFCFCNIVLIFILLATTLYDWRIVRNEAFFFGLSIIALFVQFASLITYIPIAFENLPGMQVILEGLLYAIIYVVFGGIFFTAVLSFCLRVSLNYYHFSLQHMHHVPHIISIIGPLICKYQYWVIGIYVVVALWSIPMNKDMAPIVLVLGIVLMGLLHHYGRKMMLDNLSNGLIVAGIVSLIMLVVWVYGVMNLVLPKENKDEDKKNK